MEKNNAIGQRLGEWIKSTGKKKYEIAELLGILPQQLSHVLNGRDGLGKIMQERLEKAGADVPYILTGRRAEDTKPSNPLHYIRSLERENEFLRKERDEYLRILKTYHVDTSDQSLSLVAEPPTQYADAAEEIETEVIPAPVTKEYKAAATSIQKQNGDSL